MKYDKENGMLIFSKPLRKYKNGIKILFYRGVDERERTDYPIAYADTKKGQTAISLPEESIKLFEVLVKQPRFKFFPFIWHRWEVVNPHQ